MKLNEFTVREFRSVWNSEPILVDDTVTCLVGKNESGKTALLYALYKTNPVEKSECVFDETYDYPKREVSEYQHAIESGDKEKVVVVECKWKLDDEDVNFIDQSVGSGVVKEQFFTTKTFYGDSKVKCEIEVCEKNAIKHLSSNPKFSTELKHKLSSCDDWQSIDEILQNESSMTEIEKPLKLIAEVMDIGLDQYIFDKLISPRLPQFLYFDEYYLLNGQENLNKLVERQQNNSLTSSDHPLLGLINLAKLNPTDLLDTNNTTKLKNQLEGAGNRLTKQIMSFWSQNKHLQMKFDVREAKENDPEGMREGTNIWGEIYDTVHWATTPLQSRSRGFVWFFSFLAWYEDIKRTNANLILLLDEPGLSLHGKAQEDLLRYFNDELRQHQIIYSTHSPFMIDPNRFNQVRIVQDLGIDSDVDLPVKNRGTKVTQEVFKANADSLFPLQGALGYEIHQTLFVGPNSLVIEGVSDLLYLQAVSCALQREGRTGLSNKWTLTPVGGCGKVPTFVALLAPQKGMNVAVLVDIQLKDQETIDNLYKMKLLEQNKVLTYANILQQKCADIEDMFERKFYLNLVNNEFKGELTEPIEFDKLNKDIPRVLKAIEVVISDSSLETEIFNHYRPARYFSDNIVNLWQNISDTTKDNFESLFKRLNSMLSMDG